MARYAEYADIEISMDRNTLVRLTDDNGTGEPSQEVVEQFLDVASDQINGKIGMKVSLPLALPYPTILKSWNVEIAVYYLLGRRQDAAGDIWQQRYEDAISGLNAVATGRMSLGIEDPEGTGHKMAVSYSAGTRAFSRETMSGF